MKPQSYSITSVNTHIIQEGSDGEITHTVVPHKNLINHYNQHNIEPWLDDEGFSMKPLTEVSQVEFDGKDFNFMSDGYRITISLEDMIEYGDAKIEDFKVNDEEFTLSNGLRMLGEIAGFNENLLIVRPNLKGFNNLVKKLTYTQEVSGLSNESIMWLSDPVPYFETVWMKRLSAIDLKPEDHLITCRPVGGKTVYFARPVG